MCDGQQLTEVQTSRSPLGHLWWKLVGCPLAKFGENCPLGNKVKFTASKAFSQVPLLPLSKTEIRDDNQDTALQMINCFGTFNIFVYDNHIKMGVRIKTGHADIFHWFLRIGKHISAWNRIDKTHTVCGLRKYPNMRKKQIYAVVRSLRDSNTLCRLEKKICAMRLYKICGRNKYMRFCGLYEIRIHYADWENMCAMRLCKICAQCAYVKYAQCAYISAYPQETA